METKSRVFRLLEMIVLLFSVNKKWRVKELAEHFGVSTTTIYRDFEIMEAMRIPIYEDENHTYSIMEDFYFKPPDLNRNEALALLLAGQAFQGEFFPYREALNSAVAKIINSLPSSIKSVIEDMGTYISFHHGAFVDLSEFKDIIQKVERAIEEKESLLITYYSLSSDQENQRKIDPYCLEIRNGACYLIAYCHSREEVRIFRVDRIKEVDTTGELFEIQEDFCKDKYLKNVWGVERSEEEKRVVLIFSGKAARLVREKVWHPSQEIIDLPGDRIRFEITTGSMAEMKIWVLGFGAEVEVERPAELKEAVIAEIEKMKKIYG